MVNYYKKVQPFLALSDEYIQAEFFLYAFFRLLYR
jgi:hypothetical protein